MTPVLNLITQNRDPIKGYEAAASIANRAFAKAIVVPFSLLLISIATPILISIYLPSYFISSLMGSAFLTLLNGYIYSRFLSPSREDKYLQLKRCEKIKQVYETQTRETLPSRKILSTLLKIKKEKLAQLKLRLDVIFSISTDEEKKNQFLGNVSDELRTKLIQSSPLYPTMVQKHRECGDHDKQVILNYLIDQAWQALQHYAKHLCKASYYVHILANPEETKSFAELVYFPPPQTVDQNIVVMVGNEKVLTADDIMQTDSDKVAQLFITGDR